MENFFFDPLQTSWKGFVFRGIAAFVFGAVVLGWPGVTLLTLVFLFGTYAICDGALALVSGIRRSFHHKDRAALLVLEGIVGLAAGLGAFIWPVMTGIAFIYFLAFWAITTGAIGVGAGFKMFQTDRGGAILAVSGVVSMIFGLVIAFRPVAGVFALSALIGFYSFLFGALMLGTGASLRKTQREFRVLGDEIKIKKVA